MQRCVLVPMLRWLMNDLPLSLVGHERLLVISSRMERTLLRE